MYMSDKRKKRKVILFTHSRFHKVYSQYQIHKTIDFNRLRIDFFRYVSKWIGVETFAQ